MFRMGAGVVLMLFGTTDNVRAAVFPPLFSFRYIGNFKLLCIVLVKLLSNSYDCAFLFIISLL
jgi:hypothetical protein